LLFAMLASAMLVACSPQPASGVAMDTGTSRQPVAAPVVHPIGPRIPAALPVGFSHLPPGTYEVHLHAICGGSQRYHLAYLPGLVVGAAHTGQVLVPTADFGRGWCVIVYADAVRNIVLVTQPI
jgi:hypothetical protein